MCTVIVIRRPGTPWPLAIAANRDEMSGRPWKAPARHWPDRPEVTAGLDELAGGSWLGLNDWGVAACVLNRRGSLGPEDGKRSRGELVLDALDFADAAEAAEALAAIDPRAYRPFNLVIADDRDAYWLKSTGAGSVVATALPAGASMLTAGELNDPMDPRIARHLEAVRALPAPTPETVGALEALMAEGGRLGDGAMSFETDSGFGTRSSSILLLPSTEREGLAPLWRFAPGPPDRAPYTTLTRDDG